MEVQWVPGFGCGIDRRRGWDLDDGWECVRHFEGREKKAVSLQAP